MLKCDASPLCGRLEDVIASRFHLPKKTGQLSRVGHLILVPGSAVANAFSVGLALLGYMPLIVTLGMNQRVYTAVHDYSKGFLLLERSLEHFVEAIKPQPCTDEEVEVSFDLPDRPCGVVVALFTKVLEETYEQQNLREGFFSRQVAPIIFSLSLIVGLIIGRTIDAVIGSVAAVFVLIRWGCSQYWNDLAFRGLKAPLLVFDLVECVLRVLNPGAGRFPVLSSS